MSLRKNWQSRHQTRRRSARASRVNGDGSLTAMDQMLATRSRGRALGTGLPLG
jgi:hypothetical protein